MPYSNKEKQIAYQNTWIKKRRAEWLAANGPCVMCGSNDRLQVDHIDPSKKLTHRVWSWSETRRLQELAKCQVLCFSCHVLKTTEQNPRHGEHNASAKITEETVRALRAAYIPRKRGYGYKALAEKFNLPYDTVRCVLCGRTWQHVT
jgi:5-methylcytosine-specific restriction endonuclease McrA